VKLLTTFATSLTIFQLGFFVAMMSKACRVPIMSWSIALGWPASMSGGPPVTGRRGAIPGVAVRGSVRLLAVVVATREDVQAADLQPTDYQKWRELRAQLWSREEARRMQFRFRKDPATYLANLEAQLLE
jgi:hypothetical protein